MMNDVSPEILEAALEHLDEQYWTNPKIKKIYEKVRNATATYDDAKKFAEILGQMVAESLQVGFAGRLPNDTIYENIAEKVLIPILQENHAAISEVTEYVQTDLNKRMGIGLKAKKPKFNTERAQGLVYELANAGTSNIMQTRIPAQLQNFEIATVDEAVRLNLDFHSDAGLTPTITRRTAGNACEYCKERVYSGEYKGADMPEGIFSRHRDCRCSLVYEGMKGQYQDVWSKKEYRSYQEAASKQREYLTTTDKMSDKEKKSVANARQRERRRRATAQRVSSMSADERARYEWGKKINEIKYG